jgi:2-dehydro-3-deoxygluconokinase
MGATVVTLGEAMLRLTAPAGERLRSARALEMHVAGAEANVAAALSCLGVETAWISDLPDSPLGRRVADALAAAGVCLDAVSFVPDSRLGLFFVELGAVPRPTRVWYDRAGSAFSLKDGFPEAVLDGASYAVVSGITPGIGSRSRRLARTFAEVARARGAKLCVDVNYRRLLWPAYEAREAISELLRLADVAVCSERDASDVFGCTGAPATKLEELARRWAPDADVVVLTRSELGSLVRDAAGQVVVQEPFTVEVVDRFGAGDAFVAGLLWGLLEGKTAPQAGRTGAALAALKCTTAGDLSFFRPDELRAVLETRDVIVR